MSSEETKKGLHEAIAACATKAKEATNALEALQYTQAAANAVHALINLAEYQKT